MHTLVLSLLVACGGTVETRPEAPAAPEAVAPEAATPEAAAPEAAAPEAAAPEAQAGTAHFGAPFSLDTSLAAVDVLADPAAYADKPIRVTGRVADVCQQAGCWMILSEGDKSIRVLMKDHEFSVAKDGAGAKCEIEGTIVAKVVDQETVDHLAGESARPELMPEKGKVGEDVYELVATGVSFTREG